jgi:hypothetical protein
MAGELTRWRPFGDFADLHTRLDRSKRTEG